MRNFSNQTSLLSVILLSLCISVHCTQPANPGNGRSSNNGHNANQQTSFEKLCSKICNHGNPCPPECTTVITDPWAMDTYPSNLIKRSPGIDGFTFDDYLFLRWLGRDMKRHRLQ